MAEFIGLFGGAALAYVTGAILGLISAAWFVFVNDKRQLREDERRLSIAISRLAKIEKQFRNQKSGTAKLAVKIARGQA